MTKGEESCVWVSTWWKQHWRIYTKGELANVFTPQDINSLWRICELALFTVSLRWIKETFKKREQVTVSVSHWLLGHNEYVCILQQEERPHTSRCRVTSFYSLLNCSLCHCFYFYSLLRATWTGNDKIISLLMWNQLSMVTVKQPHSL